MISDDVGESLLTMLGMSPDDGDVPPSVWASTVAAIIDPGTPLLDSAIVPDSDHPAPFDPPADEVWADDPHTDDGGTGNHHAVLHDPLAAFDDHHSTRQTHHDDTMHGTDHHGFTGGHHDGHTW